jgi:hypothetical protein
VSAETLLEIMDRMMDAVTRPRFDFVRMSCDLGRSKFIVSSMREKHRAAVFK